MPLTIKPCSHYIRMIKESHEMPLTNESCTQSCAQKTKAINVFMDPQIDSLYISRDTGSYGDVLLPHLASDLRYDGITGLDLVESVAFDIVQIDCQLLWDNWEDYKSEHTFICDVYDSFPRLRLLNLIQNADEIWHEETGITTTEYRGLCGATTDLVRRGIDHVWGQNKSSPRPVVENVKLYRLR